MPIVPESLSDVTPADVELSYALQSQYMAESNPDVELARGPFADIVLLPSSELNAATQLTVDRLQRSSSLAEIEADPALADPDIVDRALSNHNVVRRNGTKSTGSITMIVSQNATVVIPVGAIFTANNQAFVTAQAFTARSTAATITGTGDRVLTKLPDNTYSFTFDAVADVEGSTGNISRNTKLVPAAAPTYFVTCYAAADFSNGYDTESNADLIARLKLGDAAKSDSGALNYLAFIKDQDAFARTLFYSFIGIGDAEMRRDRYGLLPVSRGGCIDVYARPRNLPITTSIQLTATLVDVATWQISITRAIFPGFYKVARITASDAAATATGYALVSDNRGMSTAGEAFPPSITNITDARYTAFQTAVIRFTDVSTPIATAIGSQKDVLVYLTGMPQIGDLQALFSGADTRPLSADVLVKAAIPCFMAVGIELHIKPSAASPDQEAIIAAVVDTVNAIDFGDPVYTSLIDRAVLPLLTTGQVISRIELSGIIVDATGQSQNIRDGRVLTIPDLPEILVSPKTTAFLLDPADVQLIIKTGV